MTKGIQHNANGEGGDPFSGGGGVGGSHELVLHGDLLREMKSHLAHLELELQLFFVPVPIMCQRCFPNVVKHWSIALSQH